LVVMYMWLCQGYLLFSEFKKYYTSTLNDDSNKLKIIKK
jgi:hypothetical protein